MEGIYEIKDILNQLADRERRAIRKYFTLHYSHTKELELLRLIEGIRPDKRINIENRIGKLGYTSPSSKAFLKLKSRLKERIFDYLSSSISISEIRKIDNHSYLVHRLKKMLFQAGIMIEKDLYFQANDMLRSALRLSQEYEQFDLAAEALLKLRSIRKVMDPRSVLPDLGEKIQFYQDLGQRFTFLDNQLQDLRHASEFESMRNIQSAASELISIIELDQGHRRFVRFDLIRDAARTIFHFHRAEYHEAMSIVIPRIKSFRQESIRHELKYKFLFHTYFLEILHLSGHAKRAENFSARLRSRPFPKHFGQHLRMMENLHLVRRGRADMLSPLRMTYVKAEDNLHAIHLNCHLLFLSGDHGKCLDLIGARIRAFSTASIQALDLMVLDLLCHFEQGHHDLLDYRFQSYIKNLAYRNQFHIPSFYHLVPKLMKVLVRCEVNEGKKLTPSFYSNLQEMKNWHHPRSLQGRVFFDWLFDKMNVLDKASAMTDVSAVPELKEVA